MIVGAPVRADGQEPDQGRTAPGGHIDPLYILATTFQGPRSARLQLTFFF